MSKEARPGAPTRRSRTAASAAFPRVPAWPRWIRIAPCALALGASPLARAEFDSEKYLVYPIGDLTLRPQLEVAETYDSNLFYAEVDEVADFYTSIRPGFVALYGQRSENYFSLRYTLDASVYAERDDLNNIGNLVNHQSSFQLSRVQLRAADSFTVTDTLLGGTFSYIQKRIGLVALNDVWRADYEISPKSIAGVKAVFDYANYDADDLGQFHLYDYMAYGGGARVGYIPSEKLIIFPEVTVVESVLFPNFSTAPQAPDMTAVGFSAGAEGEFTGKLSGSINLGYELREFEDGSDIPDGWAADLQLRWQMRPKTTLTTGYRHWIQVGREAVADPFQSDRVSFGAIQELGTEGRWSVNLNAYYQFDTFDQSPRTSKYGGVSLRGNYRWQPWLTVSGGYDFYTFSDNIASIPDYDVHRFSIRMVAGY